MSGEPPVEPRWLTGVEAASRVGVDRMTVVRWDQKGLLPSTIRTLGGHRRYLETEIEEAAKNYKARGAANKDAE